MNQNDIVETVVAHFKKHYEAPLIESQSAMVFPKEILEQFADTEWTFQCFHCNCTGN